MVIKIRKIMITMTLTTVADYKQEEFNTSLQNCKNVPIKSITKLTRIVLYKTMTEVLTNQPNQHIL